MNLASRGRLPSLASDTAEDALEHGFMPRPFSEESVVDTEQNGLNGELKIQIIPTSWGDDKGHQITAFGGPGWNGKVGSGDSLQQKKNDLTNTFDDTGRRLATMYNVGEYNDTSRGNSYYTPGSDGSLDQEFFDFAEELIAMGMEDTIIRPNAEHTHPWSRRFPTDENGNQLWVDTNHTQEEAGLAYADAFARCVSVMQGYRSVNGSTVSGADFTFIFSPAGDRFAGSPDNIIDESYPTKSDLWPSGEEPPLLTHSRYDPTNRCGPSHDEWITMTDAEKKQAVADCWETEDKPFMDEYRAFADSVGCDQAMVEWGTKYPLDTDEFDSARGDNPWWYDRMINYMREHDFRWQAVWATFHFEGSHSYLWVSDNGQVADRDSDGNPDLPRTWDAWKHQAKHGEGKYVTTN